MLERIATGVSKSICAVIVAPMSTLGYAQRLSEYEAKGECGAPEVRCRLISPAIPAVSLNECALLQIFDSARVVQNKINKLVELFLNSKHIVVHTGAGIVIVSLY